MALLDAYATRDEYRTRTGDTTTGANALLDAVLAGVTRGLEKSLHLAPGAFNSHTGTYFFDGFNESVLWLRDRGGMAYFLQSVPDGGIQIDSDADGAYDDYAWDFNDAWLRGIPENAIAGSEPFRALEIVPIATAPRTTFPLGPGTLKIAAGTFGWASVPELVKDAVCHRTLELFQQMKAGGVDSRGISMLPAFEGQTRMRPQTAWMWKEIEATYGRRVPNLVT